MLAKIHKKYPKSSLVGVDPSDKAVAIARQTASGKPITLIMMRGESMKFADEFDIVFLGESLSTIKEKERVISNCWRALKKDGTIVIVEGLLPDSKFDSTESQLIMGMQLDFALQGQKFMNKKDIVVLLNSRFSKMYFQELGGNVYLVTATKK
jgi:ubiquinone/menaquinone biosynthesis C-methylase UbiE